SDHVDRPADGKLDAVVVVDRAGDLRLLGGAQGVDREQADVDADRLLQGEEVVADVGVVQTVYGKDGLHVPALQGFESGAGPAGLSALQHRRESDWGKVRH